MESLAPGKSLDRRFQLVRRLGRGGRGATWLVEDRERKERVAAKILPPDTSPERIALLKRACEGAQKLVHPNIVPIYDVHHGEELGFITTAYVEGSELRDHVGRSYDDVVRLLLPVADALDYAHRRGVVHGDLKPTKVLVDESEKPRLLDVGIAGLLAPGAVSLSVAADVHGFGALLFHLVTGERTPAAASLPRSLPEPLRLLLGRLLDPDPAKRPPSMAEVRGALESFLGAPSRVSVVPPPRIREIRPVSPEPGIRGPDSPIAAGGVGFFTWMAFVCLAATAVAVFVFLPGWVSERGSAAVDAPSEPAGIDSEAPREPADLEALSRDKTAAERAYASAARLRDGLEARHANRWGGADFRKALERIGDGEARVETRDYAGALESFLHAVKMLEGVEARAADLLSETLAAARSALASGRSTEAQNHYQLALEIAPGHPEATSGLERARKLDEVLSLVASGEARERASDLEGAAAFFRRAASLDPLSQAAQRALARVDARASERAFAAAMTAATGALEREDFAAAREALERARALRPSAPEIESLLAQVAEGLERRAIVEHRDRANELEAGEEWRNAEREYDLALALDGTLRFAQEGKKRSAARAALAEKLDFQITHPERLSDENALREATLLLGEARGAGVLGPKHEARIAKLVSLVEAFSTPVEVQILSDGQTAVTIYRVGPLGRFDRRTLDLRPGRYTVVGSRDGYRDVRRELVIEAGKPAPSLRVVCEEAI